jgi:hypothetical protein
VLRAHCVARIASSLRPHDVSTHRAVFNQTFPAGSFRGPSFGGGHSTASALLCHLNFS